ncbi:MAG: beta-ketoacyl-ACP synthase 3 [Solirubrobacteraceae bacterium]|nr:beta-ketoacyl-ACP synthase 3 [Patulibacter sp.]
MSWLEFGPEPLATLTPPRPRLRTASILGVGTALPSTVVGNAEIEARLGVEEGWIEPRTGVRERRHLAGGESLSMLAAEAARAALADAGMKACTVDLIVAATTGADDILPNLAPLVAAQLGSGHPGAYDLGAACTGFLAAVSSASAVIEAGRADIALVIGADAMSRFTDPDDPGTAPIFGDGAGAVVLGVDGMGSVGPVVLRADGDAAGLVSIPRATAQVHMDGLATYRRAVTSMHDVTLEALEAADLRVDDIDLFVYHQANRRILASVTDRLGVDPARVVDAIDTVGNTNAASLPLALAAARADGRLTSGSRVLLGACGAGFCWGAGVLTW